MSQLNSHTHCQVAQANPQAKTWQRVCLFLRTTGRQSRQNKNTERTAHGIVHAGFSGFRAFVARKKSLCKLKGNRLVIPHDTIPSTVTSNISMTTNLQDIIKGIQKQNQTMQSAFGLNSLQGIAAAIEKQNKAQFNFSGLSGLTDIARTISQQMKPLNATSLVLGNSIQAQLAAIQYPKNHSALFGLTSTLAELAKTNQIASDRLSGFATSQLLLSKNLTEIAKTLSQSHLNKFNTIDIALQGISKTYLKNIALTRNWEDISVAEEANETIANIADELLNNTAQVTVQDLDNLRQSIVTELLGLLGKTKTDKARQFIFELISTISFLLIFYNPFVIPTDKSNSEVIIETKREIEKISKEFSSKIESELNKLNKTRTARTNVNLRYSDKKNSKIIGLVKLGQQVTVIEIRHKHLLLSYIDKETGEPKSGFATKKYFDIDK